MSVTRESTPPPPPVPWLSTTGNVTGRDPRTFIGKCGKTYLIKEEVTTIEEVHSIQDKVNVVDYVSGKEVPRIFPVGAFPPLALHKVTSGLHSCRVLGRPDLDGEYGITKLTSAVDYRTLNPAGGQPFGDYYAVSSPVHFTAKAFKNCIVSNSISNGLDTIEVKLAGYQGDLHLKYYAEFAARVERAIETLVYNFIKNCGTPYPVLVIPTNRLSNSALFAFRRTIEDKIRLVLKRWYPNTCDVNAVAFVASTRGFRQWDGNTHNMVNDSGTITSCRYHDPVSGFGMNYYLVSDEIGGTIGEAWRFAHALENDVNPMVTLHGAFASVFTYNASVQLSPASNLVLKEIITQPVTAGYPAHEVIGSSDIRIVRGYSLSNAIKAYESVHTDVANFVTEFYEERAPQTLSDFAGDTRRSMPMADYGQDVLVAYSDLIKTDLESIGKNCNADIAPIVEKGLPTFIKSISQDMSHLECSVDAMVAGTNLFRFESLEFCEGKFYYGGPSEIDMEAMRAIQVS